MTHRSPRPHLHSRIKGQTERSAAALQHRMSRNAKHRSNLKQAARTAGTASTIKTRFDTAAGIGGAQCAIGKEVPVAPNGTCLQYRGRHGSVAVPVNARPKEAHSGPRQTDCKQVYACAYCLSALFLTKFEVNFQLECGNFSDGELVYYEEIGDVSRF